VLGSERQALSNCAAGQAKAAAFSEVADASWRKSSWSAANGNCVEVAHLDDGHIGVRDTKDLGMGPILIFTHSDWSAFLLNAKNGQFGLI